MEVVLAQAAVTVPPIAEHLGQQTLARNSRPLQQALIHQTDYQSMLSHLARILALLDQSHPRDWIVVSKHLPDLSTVDTSASG